MKHSGTSPRKWSWGWGALVLFAGACGQPSSAALKDDTLAERGSDAAALPLEFDAGVSPEASSMPAAALPAPGRELLEDPARGPVKRLFQRVPQVGPELGGFAYKGIGAFAVGDVDGDKLPDIVTAADFQIFKNLGNLVFESVTDSSGVSLASGLSVALGDLDNDDDLDLVVSGFQLTQVWDNDGAGHFELAFSQGGTPDLGASQILLVDLNKDSLLDVFMVYPASFNLADARVPTALWLNGGELSFEATNVDIQERAKGIGWAAAIIDYDGDGDLDIQVANDSGMVDFGFAQRPLGGEELPGNRLWRNNGQQALELVEVAEASGLGGPFSAMGALVEDFNGDGHFDVFTPDFGRNKLHLGDGSGHFVEAARSLGLEASHRINDSCDEASEQLECLLVSWGSAYRDFDLDGQDELLVLNHRDQEPQPSQLFLRDGARFKEGSLGLGDFAGHALSPTDLDGDGDLDLVLSTYYGRLHLLENTTNTTEKSAKNWLSVELIGTESNRAGIGAVVTLTLAASPGESARRQRRLVGAGGVAHASLPAGAHFGLGESIPLELEVTWPSSKVTRIARPEAGVKLTVTE